MIQSRRFRDSNLKEVLINVCNVVSDGSGPNATGPDLSSSMNSGPASDRTSNVLNKMLRFLGPFPKVGLGPTPSLGPSSEVRLRAFQKYRSRAGHGPITKHIYFMVIFH